MAERLPVAAGLDEVMRRAPEPLHPLDRYRGNHGDPDNEGPEALPARSPRDAGRRGGSRRRSFPGGTGCRAGRSPVQAPLRARTEDAPTFTIENLLSWPRVEVDGQFQRVSRETVFELIFALDMPTEIAQPGSGGSSGWTSGTNRRSVPNSSSRSRRSSPGAACEGRPRRVGQEGSSEDQAHEKDPLVDKAPRRASFEPASLHLEPGFEPGLSILHVYKQDTKSDLFADMP